VTQQVFAVKIVDKNELETVKQKQQLMEEIKCHRMLKHLNIVSFYRFFEVDQTVYIIMELCKGGNFETFLKRKKKLDTLEIQFYLRQLMRALIHMRQKRIVYRDLNLGNMLLSADLDLKLCDFGNACQMLAADERRFTRCGDIYFWAPEMVDPVSTGGYQSEVDYWALGVLLYKMITGHTPFFAQKKINGQESKWEIIQKIQDCVFDYPKDFEEKQPELHNLIDNLLKKDPARRLTFE
jgi:cell cycle serine/threonine-protein kinase CDC5/MSD2